MTTGIPDSTPRKTLAAVASRRTQCSPFPPGELLLAWTHRLKDSIRDMYHSVPPHAHPHIPAAPTHLGRLFFPFLLSTSAPESTSALHTCVCVRVRHQEQQQVQEAGSSLVNQHSSRSVACRPVFLNLNETVERGGPTTMLCAFAPKEGWSHIICPHEHHMKA
jgi:hypothetical protein